MNDQILIRILPHSGELTNESIVDWGLLDEQGHIIRSGSASIDDLCTELKEEISECNVSLIVPGQNVLLCNAAIPTKKVSQLKRALPFVIEEFLADDIENVHLALPEPLDVSGETIDVMVISHHLLINYLDVFHSNNLSPDFMIPDILAVPKAGDSWSVVIDGDKSIIRTGIMSGIVSSNNDLEMLFKPIIAQINSPEYNEVSNAENSGENKHQIFNVIASEKDEKSTQLASSIASYLRENYDFLEVEEDLYQETVSELLFYTHAESVIDDRKPAPTNILQGGYRVRKEHQNGWNQWKNVASIAVVGLLGYLLISMANGWYFSSEAGKLEEQSLTLYKKLFPNERRIVSPKKQFQNHLRQIGNPLASSSFLTLLTQLSGSVYLDDQGESVANNSITINKLRFNGGVDGLQLEIQSKSIDQLDQLKNKLENVGLSATVNSVTEQDDSMLSRVLVERL